MFYCTCNLLNKFRALICPSSGARDYTCVVTACSVYCLGCWWSAVRCRAAGYVSRMRDAARLHLCSITHPRRITCCPAPDRQPPATKALCTTCGNNTSIVLSSWWWAYKCPKRVEQITDAINHSVSSSWFSSLCKYNDVWTNIHQIQNFCWQQPSAPLWVTI
jgi:hypothetical protein